MDYRNTEAFRIAFSTVKSVSIFCGLAGSTYSLWDGEHPNKHNPSTLNDYVWILGFATLAAGGVFFLTYKIQKTLINSKKTTSTYRYPSYLTKTTSFSYTGEISFLVFSTVSTLIYNFFLIAALKSTTYSLRDPLHDYPLSPLNFVGYLLFGLKSALIDLPFDWTSSTYSTMEKIKEKITGSISASIVSWILSPFGKEPLYCFVKTWVRFSGILSKTLTNYLGVLLSVSPHFWTSTYEKNQHTFWVAVAVTAPISTIILLLNMANILYLEGEMSKINLQTLRKKQDPLPRYSLFSDTEENKPSAMDRLLAYAPFTKRPIQYSFYSESLIRAASELLPIVLFIRDFFQRHSWSGHETIENTIIITISLVTFCILLAESLPDTKKTIENYKSCYIREEKDIESRNTLLSSP